jgi:hypothetical protein
MALEIEDRYKEAMQHWRFASEIRFKILAAWWGVYVGLAIVFGWIWKDADDFKKIAFVIPLVAFVATVLFWLMDDRNGGAIRGSKNVVMAIETAAEIPAEQRLVEQCDKSVLNIKHATAIHWFAGIMGALLLGATWYLFCNRNG